MFMIPVEYVERGYLAAILGKVCNSLTPFFILLGLEVNENLILVNVPVTDQYLVAV